MMGGFQFTGSIKRVIKAFVENDALVQYLASEMASFQSFHGPIYTQKSFFEQYLPEKIQSVNKVTFFKAIAYGRKVLHVGCCDWPIMDIKTGLHKQLSEVAGELVGFDTASEDLKKMQVALPNFRFINDLRELEGERFDLVLVPDVLEHVKNVGDFLEDVHCIEAVWFVFSTPNAFSSEIHRGLKRNVEQVHPDHKYYFSPYTLHNCLSVNGFYVHRLLGYDNKQGLLKTRLRMKNPLRAHGLIAVCTRGYVTVRAHTTHP